MKTMTYKERQMAWAEGYYSQIVGFTVVGVSQSQEGHEVWTTLICEKTDAKGKVERMELEISQDPEGNGPGFLFGLPHFRVS